MEAKATDATLKLEDCRTLRDYQKLVARRMEVVVQSQRGGFTFVRIRYIDEDMGKRYDGWSGDGFCKYSTKDMKVAEKPLRYVLDHWCHDTSPWVFNGDLDKDVTLKSWAAEEVKKVQQKFIYSAARGLQIATGRAIKDLTQKIMRDREAENIVVHCASHGCQTAQNLLTDMNFNAFYWDSSPS